jgi:uncharacterized membrane protein
VIVITAALVFALGHKSIFVELNISLAIISGCLFLFTTAGLYIGVKVQQEKKEKVRDKVEEKMSDVHARDILEASPDIPLDFDIPDDPISLILAILGWIALTIGVTIVLANLFTFLWGGIASLAVMIYWVFYKALRRIFAKSRKCMGSIKLSLLYGVYYTVLYCGWIYFVVIASNLIKQHYS